MSHTVLAHSHDKSPPASAHWGPGRGACQQGPRAAHRLRLGADIVRLSAHTEQTSFTANELLRNADPGRQARTRQAQSHQGRSYSEPGHLVADGMWVLDSEAQEGDEQGTGCPHPQGGLGHKIEEDHS